jgi:hypothetical protein
VPKRLSEVLDKGFSDDDEPSKGKVKNEPPSDVPKVVMHGVVKRIKNKLVGTKTPCLNLTLESKPYPRLYLTSTQESHGKEGIYKKDILMFSALKAVAKRAD